jgi:hypothetical protein
MKILVNGLTGETTPPLQYGGIERVNAFLIKGLQELGHSPKFICKEGSQIQCEKMTAKYGTRPERIMREVSSRWGSFDIVHDSTCNGGYYRLTKKTQPSFWTVHGIGGDGDLCAYLSKGSMLLSPHEEELPYTHLGLDLSLYEPCYAKEDYILFLGQALRNRKYLHYFLEVAKAHKLKAIAIIPSQCVDTTYFEECSRIYPFAWIRGADDETKMRYLRKAKALIHCSNEGEGDGWQDASPVAVLEALAVGTPVIGNYSGGIPEMIENGKTGFLVQSAEEAVDAYSCINDIYPEACREYMETYRNHVIFASRMVALYEMIRSKGYSARRALFRRAQSKIDEVVA